MSETSKVLSIGYGLLNPTIAEQIASQSFPYAPKTCKEFEDIRKALNNLRWADMLSDSQMDKLTEKLHKRVTSHVKQQLKKQKK